MQLKHQFTRRTLVNKRLAKNIPQECSCEEHDVKIFPDSCKKKPAIPNFIERGAVSRVSNSLLTLNRENKLPLLGDVDEARSCRAVQVVSIDSSHRVTAQRRFCSCINRVVGVGRRGGDGCGPNWLLVDGVLEGPVLHVCTSKQQVDERADGHHAGAHAERDAPLGVRVMRRDRSHEHWTHKSSAMRESATQCVQ